MTKKDYELIANIIYGMYLGHDEWVRSGEQVIRKFAEQLSPKNPRFDSEKFQNACRGKK